MNAPAMMMGLDRRVFLKALSSAVHAGQQAVHVPWSAGVEPPKTKAPLNATDCHHHIYDPRFPMAKNAMLRPGPATVSDYLLFRKRIGITRNIVVQPSTYGLDNRCLVNALQQFGTSATCGIAVATPEISDTQLKEWNVFGVRGLRFNLIQMGATNLEMLEPLARRIAPLGWHVQLNASPEQIVAASSLFDRLPCPVVFDHFGHTLEKGPGDPAFAIIVKLLRKGTGWLKLSGAYLGNKVGDAAYPASTATAKAYLAEAPHQLLWGSDWPHPTAREKPDDARIFDLLAQWIPDEALRHRVLVRNPARLYGFV